VELRNAASSASSPRPPWPSPARAARRKAEGKDIIGLGAGEPDFDTPVHMPRRRSSRSARASRATRRWAASPGTQGRHHRQVPARQRTDLHRLQMLVSTGAKQTIYNLCMALLDPGDEAMIPAPYWVSYPDMVLLADGVPVTPTPPPSRATRSRRPARARDHAAHPPVLLNSPQPDRRRLHARRTAGARRSAARASARDRRHR
jgi:aspartate aminotransferase